MQLSVVRHALDVLGVAWSVDDKLIATASADGTIQVGPVAHACVNPYLLHVVRQAALIKPPLTCWRPPEGASGRETCVGADLGRGGARRRCVGSPYAGCQVGFAQRSGKWKLLHTPAGCVFESIGSACMAFRSWRLHGIQAECSWPRHRWTLQCRRGSLLCLVHTADSFHMALGSTTECSRSSHAGGSCRHYALRSSAVCAISSLSRA
jgi:hypothetical protein